MKIKITAHDMELAQAGYRIGEIHDVIPAVAEQLVSRGGVEIIEEAAIDFAPENKMEPRKRGRPRKVAA